MILLFVGYIHIIMYYNFFTGEDVTIDRNEFKNKAFQCVFQYLRRFDARMDLSSFIHKGPSVEGDYPTCISTIKKYVSNYYIPDGIIFYERKY